MDIVCFLFQKIIQREHLANFGSRVCATLELSSQPWMITSAQHCFEALFEWGYDVAINMPYPPPDKYIIREGIAIPIVIILVDMWRLLHSDHVFEKKQCQTDTTQLVRYWSGLRTGASGEW